MVRALRELYPGRIAHGQWFKFEDANGNGYCQTDVLVNMGEWLLLIEAKLSQRERAWDQLFKLYLPVVEWLWPGIPVATCQATQFLNGYVDGELVKSPEEISPDKGRKWLWLLLG